MAFRAVLFDLDGTLLNTLQDIANSVNTVLARAGLPTHDIDAYRYFVGDGSYELARRVLPERYRDKQSIAEMVNEIDDEYNRRWAENTTPYAGIPTMLDGLTRMGFNKCILSNKPQIFTELTTARFLSTWQFDIIMGAQPGIPRKPDPTAALKIARKLNFKPEEFLYLGDTATDIKTATAAGMYPAGAVWGFRTAAELREAGAKVLAESPAEITQFLEKQESLV